MEYLFDREQIILDNARKHINELQDGESVSKEMFETLVKEYDMILKQLEKVVKISDKASEILVSEQKYREELINDLVCKVHFDTLTGIYNRYFLKEALNGIIKTLQRSAGGGAISVLMIDIDYFKEYNDTYGHVEGDNCIRIIATALKDSITRDDDFAARYGGEEFAVVLPNTEERGVVKVAERIIENIKARNILHEKSEMGYATVSIGAATGNVNSVQSGIDYIKRADEALYISKQNGRNKYTYLKF